MTLFLVVQLVRAEYSTCLKNRFQSKNRNDRNVRLGPCANPNKKPRKSSKTHQYRFLLTFLNLSVSNYCPPAFFQDSKLGERHVHVICTSYAQQLTCKRYHMNGWRCIFPPTYTVEYQDSACYRVRTSAFHAEGLAAVKQCEVNEPETFVCLVKCNWNSALGSLIVTSRLRSLAASENCDQLRLKVVSNNVSAFLSRGQNGPRKICEASCAGYDHGKAAQRPGGVTAYPTLLDPVLA